MNIKDDLAVCQINTYPGRPTIIFLHDSLGCIKLWRDFPEKLGKLTECNVFIYDRYGYGGSAAFLKQERDNLYMEEEADLLVELVEEYKLHKPILFGHSDGGSIALIASGKYPGKFKAAITEGAHVFVEEETLKGINASIVLYGTTDLKSKLEKYHGTKTEAMFWAWAKTWNTPEFKNWNIEKFLSAIRCPLLVIQGDEDEYGTEKQVDSIIGQVSGKAVKLFLPGIKHTPHKECPVLILEKSSEFINKWVLI